MPFIIARTSAVLEDAQKVGFVHRVERAVAHVPGKSEADTLEDVRDGCSMWLYGGDAYPVAYVNASSVQDSDSVPLQTSETASSVTSSGVSLLPPATHWR